MAVADGGDPSEVAVRTVDAEAGSLDRRRPQMAMPRPHPGAECAPADGGRSESHPVLERGDDAVEERGPLSTLRLVYEVRRRPAVADALRGPWVWLQVGEG